MAANQPLAFTLVPLKDLARGIDLRSAETNLPDGYCEDLVNVDTVSSGQLAKRKGYQGYAGYVPMRVQSMRQNGSQIEFKVGSGIDLTGVPSSPINVYGRIAESVDANYNKTDTFHDYPSFSVDVRETFSVASTTVAKTAIDTGATSPYLLADVLNSLSSSDRSNTWVEPDSLAISTSSFTLTVTDAPVTTESAYIAVLDEVFTAGSSYIYDGSAGVAPAGGDVTISLSAVTHGLSNFNIIARCYDLSGTTLTHFWPNTLDIDTTTGAVSIVFPSAGTWNGYVVLACAPSENYKQISVAAGATQVLTVSAITQFYPIWGIYRLNGSNWEQVLPNVVAVDEPSATLNVTIVNGSVSVETYAFYWTFATIRANTIRVADIGGTTDSTSPQVTIWGVGASAGSVNHIDSYKRDLEDRVVCGMSGNIFAARTRDEIGTAYELPQFTIDMSMRVSSDVTLAPLFWPTGNTTARTRGIITGDNVANGYATVTAMAYVSSGVADYTVSLVGMVGALALNTQISTYDSLTVGGMAHSACNGTFPILSVPATTATSVTLRVTNAAVTLSDFDETGASGYCNVFTDKITFTTSPNLLTGDTLDNDTIAASGLSIVVAGNAAPDIYVSGITAAISFATGSTLFGGRDSYIHVLKNTASVTSTRYLVRNDMVSISGMARQPRVTYVNPFHDMAVHCDVSGGTGVVSMSGFAVVGVTTGTFASTAHGFSLNDPVTVSSSGELPTLVRTDVTYYVYPINVDSFHLMTSEDDVGSYVAADGGSGTVLVFRVHNLGTGQRVMLARSEAGSGLDGVHTVTGVLDRRRFTFATSATPAIYTSNVVGRTAEFDESLTLSDSLSSAETITVNERWIPVECPSTIDDRPPVARVSHFQDMDTAVRSCMVAGSMFFVNNTDQVMKFDGDNIYQAGLFRWQSSLFAQVDATGSSINLSAVSATVDGISAGQFQVGETEAGQFKVGSRIVHSQDGGVYTVQSIDTYPVGVSYVYVLETITGTASGTLKAVRVYHYYARLNAVDANQNVIASAVTSSQDLIVELSATGNIRHRIVAMPPMGMYDYDRLQVQLYRTKGDVTTPYYRVATADMIFDEGCAYIDINDSVNDATDLAYRSALVGDDSTMVALKGNELGTAWEQPPRAKHICSANNRLLLANLTDYQQLDIVLRKTASASSVTAANFSGMTFLFKKDSTDTGTSTNMNDRVKFEFVTTGQVTITPATDIVFSNSGFVVTKAAHGLVKGNWVYMFNSASGTTKSLHAAGWHQLTAVTVDTFTVEMVNASYSAGATDCNRYVAATTKTDVPVWLGTDGNYSALKNGNSSGTYEIQASIRLANAINAVMSAMNPDAYTAPIPALVPWMTAASGGEYALGQVIVRVPKYSSTFLSVTPATYGTNYDVYINDVKRAASTAVSATEKLFPSRVVISYENYPELFDNPCGPVTVSDSAVDVNTADGEEISGIIPFFGSSAFSASQVENTVVVFKTSSVYILNLETRQIQKIDSRGLGCTAPASISATSNGIMFANLSGVYRLNRDLTVAYVGRNLERYWKETVNADSITTATGHNYGIGRQYKLSVPVDDDSENSVVLVYDHTRETSAYANASEVYGAWTRYTNHPATGWCSLNSDSFFSTSTGQVFKVRANNDATDYRDDGEAVAEMTIVLRANDCGLPGLRKVCRAVVTHLRMETSITSALMYSAVDNNSAFQTIGTIVNTSAAKKVSTFRSSLPTPRFVYLTIKYTHSVKDEAFVLAGVDLLVAQLSQQGLVERSELS